jgi:negative modulator of initiation of replication
VSTPQPHDEFDAARIVVDVLRSLQPDEQARAIRYAQEKLAVVRVPSPPATGVDGVVGTSRAIAASAKVAHELTTALSDPEFRRLRSAVDKMLHLLGAAYRLRPEAFEKVVLPIRGRHRRYFGKSEAEVANSGSSTQPRNIPGTEIWVMTNSPTPQKQDMLEEALRLMGFSIDAIRDAVAAIE